MATTLPVQRDGLLFIDFQTDKTHTSFVAECHPVRDTLAAINLLQRAAEHAAATWLQRERVRVRCARLEVPPPHGRSWRIEIRVKPLGHHAEIHVLTTGDEPVAFFIGTVHRAACDLLHREDQVGETAWLSRPMPGPVLLPPAV